MIIALALLAIGMVLLWLSRQGTEEYDPWGNDLWWNDPWKDLKDDD